MSIERTIAHDLLSIGAVFLRPDDPFTWASGIKSPIYCDNRLTLTAPEVRTHVETGLVDLICKHYPGVEVLMGTSTAGIAHAAIVGHMMGLPVPHWFFASPTGLWVYAAVQMVLLIPILILNRAYFTVGFSRLVKGAPNMDTLVALGAAAGVIYSLITLLAGTAD